MELNAHAVGLSLLFHALDDVQAVYGALSYQGKVCSRQILGRQALMVPGGYIIKGRAAYNIIEPAGLAGQDFVPLHSCRLLHSSWEYPV